MRKFFVVTVLATFFLSACSSKPPVKETAPKRTPKEGVVKEVVHLSPADGLDQTGTATVEDLGGGKVRVFVRIDHANDSVLPVSLNNGDCSSIGDVKFPLQDVRQSNSDNTLTNVAMKDIQTLAVVVYHPKGDSRPTVCGMIE